MLSSVYKNELFCLLFACFASALEDETSEQNYVHHKEEHKENTESKQGLCGS